MKIGAVIVLYNPDIKVLSKGLTSLCRQVDTMVLVDNSMESFSFLAREYDNLVYIPLGKNNGIAAAQNIGINFLLKNNFDFVLFSDQDSCADDNIVKLLLDSYKELENLNCKVGAIGTRGINKQTGKKYKNKVLEVGPVSVDGLSFSLTESRSVMSSISLISMKTLSDVGYLDELLFIDGVDYEWGWRARKKGYFSFINEQSCIYHQMGEGDRKAFFISARIPTPFRCYYQYRNYIWLCFLDYTPIKWKVYNFFKYLIKIFYYCIVLDDKKNYFFNIVNGLKDGFKGCKRYKLLKK